VKTGLDIVVLGLSITSSWGNGHATTYRGLIRELASRGHRVLFLERDVPWYSSTRDMPSPPFCQLELYSEIDELERRFAGRVATADAVIVGSYVPQGVAVGEWVLSTAAGTTAFYDIDTPITLAGLAAGGCDYLDRDQVARYDLYLSFSGGPTLRKLEGDFGSPLARALHCSVDPALHSPREVATRWDLGYLGTYSADRQPSVDLLLVSTARRVADGRFVVAGAQYPPTLGWPGNVDRIDHVEPREHAEFYSAQRFTLNVTRADMIAAGFAPSVRLFEAAACGVPIISDRWEGVETFFSPGEEILLAADGDEVCRHLREVEPPRRARIAARARARVLGAHTSAHRAAELELFLAQARSVRERRSKRRKSSTSPAPGLSQNGLR
jgi:spore maturation protein CgeB